MAAVRRGRRAYATTAVSDTERPVAATDDATTATAPVAGALHHTVWAADEDYARRVAGAVFWRWILPWVLAGVVLVSVPAALVLRTGPSFLLTVLVLLPIVAWAVHALMVRQVRRQLPAGSRLALALEPEHLFLTGPLGASHVRYEGLSRVQRLGRVVRLRQGSTRLFLAGELLPDDALDELARRITAARGR